MLKIDKFKDTSTEIVPVTWPNDNISASYFVVTLYLQRKTLYYAFNFIYPCIIISILCIVGFVLPAESSEKITLGKKKIYLIVALFFIFRIL